MLEYPGFILLTEILWDHKFVSDVGNSGLGLHKFHCTYTIYNCYGGLKIYVYQNLSISIFVFVPVNTVLTVC